MKWQRSVNDLQQPPMQANRENEGVAVLERWTSEFKVGLTNSGDMWGSDGLIGRWVCRLDYGDNNFVIIWLVAD